MAEPSDFQVPCNECDEEFNPTLSKKRGWTCPNCQTRHPNLSLHYRVLAYISALGLAGTIFLLAYSLHHRGHFSWGHLLPVAQSALLLVAFTALVFQDRPWENVALKAALWLVYGNFVLFYTVEPLLIVVLFNASITRRFLSVFATLLVLLVGVGAYLAWLHRASHRLSPTSG